MEIVYTFNEVSRVQISYSPPKLLNSNWNSVVFLLSFKKVSSREEVPFCRFFVVDKDVPKGRISAF